MLVKQKKKSELFSVQLINLDGRKSGKMYTQVCTKAQAFCYNV